MKKVIYKCIIYSRVSCLISKNLPASLFENYIVERVVSEKKRKETELKAKRIKTKMSMKLTMNKAKTAKILTKT